MDNPDWQGGRGGRRGMRHQMRNGGGPDNFGDGAGFGGPGGGGRGGRFGGPGAGGFDGPGGPDGAEGPGGPGGPGGGFGGGRGGFGGQGGMGGRRGVREFGGGPGGGFGGGRRGFGGGGGFGGGRGGFGGGGGRHGLDLNKLGLSETQREKIKAMREQTRTKSRGLRTEYQKHQMSLRNLMFSPDATEAQIRAARKQALAAQTQMEELQLNDFILIRKALTADQRKKLPEIMPGNPRGGGGGPGPEGGPPEGEGGDFPPPPKSAKP